MPDLNVSLSQGNPITVSVNGSGAATATVTAGGTANVTVTGAIPNPGAGTVIVSSGGIADLTSTQQNQISQGVVVVTTDGYRFIYSGAGSKVDQASYVLLSDTTPTWASIEGKPTTDGITEGTSNLYHTTGRAAAAAPVQSVAGRTGAVTLAVADVSGAAAASHAHGNITTDGKIGTTAGIVVSTGTGGTLVASAAAGVKVGALTVDNGVGQLYSEDGWLIVEGSQSGTSIALRDTEIYCNAPLSFAPSTDAADDTRINIGAAAATHSHGNITTAGAIGTTSGLPIITTTAGVLTAGAFGTTAGTFCVGNDARLSDARTPTAHKTSHATGGSDAIAPADIGAAAASHSHSAADITSGTVATARLGSGTASSSTFLRGDQTFAAPPVTSVDGSTGAVTVTKSDVFVFTRTSKPASATGATPGPYTWAIPDGVKAILVQAKSAGGGGGSGRRGAAGTARGGGGGGGGGAYAEMYVRVDELSTRTLSVTVGGGGAGGAAPTSDDANGNSGSSGGTSFVLVGSSYLMRVLNGGGGGGGGTTSAGSAGASSTGRENGGAGSAGGVTAAGSGGGNLFTFGSAGGGGGGGVNTSNAAFAGGAGNRNFIQWQDADVGGGAAGGFSGADSVSVTDSGSRLGGLTAPGGGGGGGHASGGGGAGGNGIVGGGGGGAGGGTNGVTGGAGGNGGDGIVRITVWY